MRLRAMFLACRPTGIAGSGLGSVIGKGGWRDKSSAVGRAACGWFHSVFSAVAELSLPSLRSFYPFVSMIFAPSFESGLNG